MTRQVIERRYHHYPKFRLMSPFLRIAISLILTSACVFADDVTPLDIGASAPDFDLPGIDGRNHTLDDYADAKVLAIVFTCNHCPTAQAYEDRLIALHNDYVDKGVALVAISPNDPVAVRLDELGYTDLNDTLEEMKIRAEMKGFPFPYLYDGDVQDVTRAYGAQATPHVYLFDQDRKLRFQGRIDNGEKPKNITSQDTRDAIDALLAGQPVVTETTKVFGCSVKWADKRDEATRSLEKWAKEEVSLDLASVEDIKELMANDSENLRLVNVWATWCGPCVTEFPHLVEMNRMYRGREFEVVTLSADEPERISKALRFLEKAEASMTNFIFNQADHYEMIEAVDPEWPGPLPYTALVAPGGEILYRKTGAFDALEVKGKIVDILGRVYQ